MALCEPEWHKLWPAPIVPDLSSPPKGRNYRTKSTHRLSDSSSDENNAKKHKMDKSDQSDQSDKSESPDESSQNNKSDKSNKSEKSDNESEKSDKSDRQLSPEKSKTGKVPLKPRYEKPKPARSSSKSSENSTVYRIASIFNTQKKTTK